VRQTDARSAIRDPERTALFGIYVAERNLPRTATMKKTAEYRAHAADCWRMAGRTSNIEHKSMLTKMADTWDLLARQQEVRFLRHRRIAEIEGREISDDD